MTNSNQQQIHSTSDITLGLPRQKSNPPNSPKQLTLGQGIDQQILESLSANLEEKTLRAKFVKTALSTSGVVGVCFLIKDDNDHWMPSISSPTSGRLPDHRKFALEYSEKCDEISKSRGVRTQPLESMDKMVAVFAPIIPQGAPTEILMLVAQNQKDALTATRVAQKIAGAVQIWLNGQSSADADWQVNALAAILEIVAKVENQTHPKEACQEIVNLLASRLGCTQVAIGLQQKTRFDLMAVAGVNQLDQGSETGRNFRQALVESVTRKHPGVYPPIHQENNHLLQAHKQLAAHIHAPAIYTCPLVTEDEEQVGAILLGGEIATLHSEQFARFMGTATPAISNSLRIVDRAKDSSLKSAKSKLGKLLSLPKRIILLGLLIAFSLLMFLPITYRVRCNCVTEPVTKRFAVAPFQGQIVSGFVEPGDHVKADQVLAEMDGRTIRWDLSGVVAERDQSIRTREDELAKRNVNEAVVAGLEYDRLISQQKILEYKQDHLQIKSPIDGIVLSGSLERAEAASVETGEVLFEIGPMKPMRFEIAIPSNEIAQVKSGFKARIWIEGQEEQPIDGEITRIHPRSETRDAKNVYIAEIEFPNDDERFRPGMKGSVRIDCEKRSLGWSLFHKPMNWMRSRLTWW